jgi:hypothetical protein
MAEGLGAAGNVSFRDAMGASGTKRSAFRDRPDGSGDESRTKLDGLAFRAEGHVSYLTINVRHCS